MRFHVLGIGSIGTFISHHLRLANPDAPISLVVRSASRFPSTFKYPRGKEEGQAIKLSVTRNGHTSTSDRFDQEIYQTRQTIDTASADVDADANANAEFDPDSPYGTIQSLVVCLKAPTTVPALSQLKHRIAPNSVIALLQNGMGVYDELCEKVWPEPATRPFFLLGTTTHGVTSSKIKGQVTHMSRDGEGDIKWGLVPDPRQEVDLERWVWGKRVSDTPILTPPESPSLPLPPPPVPPNGTTDLSNVQQTLSALLSLPELNSTLLPMPHIHHTLLLKLALNANINPLTAILGAGSLPNGALLGSSPSRRLIRMLSGETSSIITSYLHQLHAPRSPPNDVLRLYTRDSLVSRTLALCHATARNSSSMAVDASSGRMTEIDYINGYLVSLAERLNIPTPHHEMVTDMVKFTAEVTGLQYETGTRSRQAVRVAKRQHAIKSNLVNQDARTKAHKDTRGDQSEQEQEQEWTEQEKEIKRKARRNERKREKVDQYRQDRLEKQKRRRSGPGLKEKSLDSTLTTPESKSGVDEGDEQSKSRSATLAHLDQLAKAGPRLTTPKPADTPESEGKEETEETEEQAEAIKAIESRIFSRSGRRGF